MQIMEKNNHVAKVSFSENEAYMIRDATSGPVFLGTTNRDIPVLDIWNKSEALDFEQRIREQNTIAKSIYLIFQKMK